MKTGSVFSSVVELVCCKPLDDFSEGTGTHYTDLGFRSNLGAVKFYKGIYWSSSSVDSRQNFQAALKNENTAPDTDHECVVKLLKSCKSQSTFEIYRLKNLMVLGGAASVSVVQ